MEIRRSYDLLISTKGFPILLRWHLYKFILNQGSEVQSNINIVHLIPYILSFWSTFQLKYQQELCHFKILTYFFKPRDLVVWSLTLTNQRLMSGTILHMLTKFSDDWLKIVTSIMENVTISFKHEYRRPTLTSGCDVMNGVISAKIIIWHDLQWSLHIWCQI